MSSQKEEKKEYIVGICNTDADGVSIYRVVGTQREVMHYLLDAVKEDKVNAREAWEYGSTRMKDIECRFDGSLYAYGCYSDYHIDYEATPVENISVVTL